MSDVTYKLERLLFNLDTLAELCDELTSPKDFHRILKSSLYMIMGNFAASKGVMFQFDNDKKTARLMASKGVGDINDVSIKLEKETIRGLVSLKTPIDISCNEKTISFLGEIKTDLERIKVRILVPLVVRENCLGFIAIGEKFSGEVYSKDDFRLLSVITHHIAVSLHNQSLLKKLMGKYDENKKLYEDLSFICYDTIHAFATAIDAKDAYTKGHSHRVSTYCAVIAHEMKLSHDEKEGLRIAGLLHDVGKIAIDKSIINKDSPLTNNELVELNSHPVIGYDILSKVKFPWSGVSKLVRNHHERVDGRGYPDHLMGGDIVFGAKIMSVADSFDAMTTDRPYRPALTINKALAELKENCGKQFDRDVVMSFLSVLRNEAGKEGKSTTLPFLTERFTQELKNETLETFLL